LCGSGHGWLDSSGRHRSDPKEARAADDDPGQSHRRGHRPGRPAITYRANARLDRERWVRERRAETYIDALAVLGRIAAYVSEPEARPNPFEATAVDQWRRFAAQVEAFASTQVIALRDAFLAAWERYRAAVDAVARPAAPRTAAKGHQEEADALDGGAQALRRGIRSLRTLLVEIYPPSLHRAGLPAALRDLLDPLAGRGIEVRLQVPDAVEVGDSTAELVFRVAQEAVRNVAEHSAAAAVDVRLEAGATVRLTVADDGIGFDVARLADTPAGGHVGLLLLQDLARTAGGTLELDSSPGRGTRIHLEVPAG
jgi:signal transduction histidine kinase